MTCIQVPSIPITLAAPPGGCNNGYCRQPYTSTWTGSAWGDPVASGAATCEATFPSAPNVWVTDGASEVPAGSGTDVLGWAGTGGGNYSKGDTGPLRTLPGTAADLYRIDYVATGTSEGVLDGLGVQCACVSPGNAIRQTEGGVGQSSDLGWGVSSDGNALPAFSPPGSGQRTVTFFIAGGEQWKADLSSDGSQTISALFAWTATKLNVQPATATFTNAAGTGDFDCVVGGEACAGVPAAPCGLPPP